MTKKPFISIVIPTYNRAKDLQLALSCILSQSFIHFEIIISDNASTDNTEEIVTKIKDARITYIRNKTNIGWVPSMTNAINHAKGDYILLHGDDDFMLYDTTLKDIADVLKIGYAFARINYLNISPDKRHVFSFHPELSHDMSVKQKEVSAKITDFIETIDIFFMTGIIFKNSFPKNVQLLDSELAPWLQIVYSAMQNGGGYFIAKPLFVASWSQPSKNPPRYYLKDGKFQFESYYLQFKNIINNEVLYQKFFDHKIQILIKELPAAKYYTTNSNLIEFSKRLLEIAPKEKFSVVFWFWFLTSLLVPKFMLKYMRDYVMKKTFYNTKVAESVLNRITYLTT
jgi:glycosyltransferase involved in cell wall biosynthesis